MKGDKRKKLKPDSPLIKQSKSTIPQKLHFNISYDNLRCFMNPSKSLKTNKRKNIGTNNKPKQTVEKEAPEQVSSK